MQDIFDANFDKDAYEAAKNSIEAIILSPNSLEFMMRMTDGYDYNESFDPIFDDADEWCPSFRCEVELDRSRMESDADYVSVEFVVEYDKDTRKGRIADAILNIGGTSSGINGAICRFDPETCEITDWIY